MKEMQTTLKFEDNQIIKELVNSFESDFLIFNQCLKCFKFQQIQNH
jgi:hypothetical protein